MSGRHEEIRLTFYEVGVDQLGGAVDFTVREDQLSGVSTLGGSRARPLEARSETLRGTVRVLDPDDTLTVSLYGPDGAPQILGRLFEMEVRYDGGTWTTLTAGRVQSVRQTEAVREYEFELADEIRRLREQSAFDPSLPEPFGGGADTTSILPMGVTEDWKNLTAITPMEYVVVGFGETSDVVAIALGPGTIEHGAEDIRKGPATMSESAQDLIFEDMREGVSPLGPPTPERDEGDFEHLRFRDVTGEQDVELFASPGDLTAEFGGMLGDADVRQPMRSPRYLWLYWPGNNLSVGEIRECYLYMPDHPPTEELPKHFGGGDGVGQWQHVKDGLDAIGVRYDSTAIDNLIGTGETIWPRVTSNPTMLAYLRRRVFRQTGYMLAPSPEGMTPVRITVPTHGEVPDVTQLTTLDKTTISGPDYPTWEHHREDQVTAITFRCSGLFSRNPMWEVYAGPSNLDKSIPGTLVQDTAVDGLRNTEFEIERTHRVDDFGRHEMTIELSGYKSKNEFERVASQLAEEIFSRWGEGSVVSALGTMQAGESVGQGEFILIDLVDFPNGEIPGRGGIRLMQVIERQRDVQPGVSMHLLDAGPDDQPLSAPSISVSQNSDRPESVLDVSVSGIDADAGAWILHYAQSTSDPSDDSDLWMAGGSFAWDNTVVTLEGLEAGTDYWVRARAVGVGRIASPYSTHANATTAGAGTITDLSVDVLNGSDAVATWSSPNDDFPVQYTLTNDTSGTVEDEGTLDEGTEEKLLTGLSAGDSYTLELRMVDASGGVGPATSTTFTAGAESAQLPAPDFVGVQYGRSIHRGEHDIDSQSGIVVWTEAADPAVPLVFQRAPDDGSANPDTNSIEEFRLELGVQRLIDTEVKPGEGAYWYRALHRSTGYEDSDPTEWARAWPIPLPPKIGRPPSRPLLDLDLRVDATSGQVTIYVDGVPEVRSIRYDTGTNGFSGIDANSGTLVTTNSDGNVEVSDAFAINKGEFGYVEIAAYPDEVGEDSPTAFRSGSVGRGDPESFLAEVDVGEGDFDGDGTQEARAILTITGGGTYEVVPEVMHGRDATFSSPGSVPWASISGSTTGMVQGDSITVIADLVQKLATFIRFDVLDDVSGEKLGELGPYTFDPGEVPNFEDVGVSVRDDGTVEVDVLGDAVDTQSIEAAVDLDGSGTADETLTAGNLDAPTNTLNQVTSSSMPKGASGTVTITLYSNADRTGTSNSKKWPISRGGAQSAAQVAPTVELSENTRKSTATNFGVEVLIRAGREIDSPDLEYRYKMVGGSSFKAWTDWLTAGIASPVTIGLTFQRSGKTEKTFEVQARDKSASTNPFRGYAESSVASITIPPKNEGLTSDAGKVHPGQPYGGGSGVKEAGEYPESKRGATRRMDRGAQTGARDYAQTRIDEGGYVPRFGGGRFTSPVYDDAGVAPLLDPAAREIYSTDLVGAQGATVDGQAANLTRDGAVRSRSGLNPTGQLLSDVLRSDGMEKLIDTAGSALVNLAYSSGAHVDAVEPAEAGSDVTGQHTAADTDAVSGTASSTVEEGSSRANIGLNASGQLLADILDAGGTATLIDTSLEEVDQLAYPSGAVLSGLEPAEAGSDVTGQNTANDTDFVSGQDSALTRNGAVRSRDITIASTPSGPLTYQLQEQRVIPQVSGANVQAVSADSTGSSPLSGHDDGSSARIDIAAHDVQYGFGTVSYNSGSITALAFEQVYFVYVDDGGFDGGTVTYHATTNAQNVTASHDRYYVGVVETPADGGGSTGGGGGGGSSCVAADAVVGIDAPAPAAEVAPGDPVEALMPEVGRSEAVPVQATREPVEAACVELAAPDAQLIVSAETPCTLRDGAVVRAAEAGGKKLPVWSEGGGYRWEEIEVEPVGVRKVVRLSIGLGVFPAGQGEGRIYTHNSMELK